MPRGAPAWTRAVCLPARPGGRDGATHPPGAGSCPGDGGGVNERKGIINEKTLHMRNGQAKIPFR